MSPRLALHLLGTPHIDLDGTSIHLERRKSVALLAYLAVEGGQHRRESLSSLLWPDTNQSNAFKNLRQILWEIQQSLGEGVLISDREKICLSDGEQAGLDVHEFEALISRSNGEEGTWLRIPLLVDAIKLYRNHFLTGFSLKDAHPFNDWAFAEAEDLRHKLSLVLGRLSEDFTTLGQAKQAIPYARRLVSLDPLDEAAHRRLMEVYLQAGQHSAALKQYETCEQILRKELNLDPQPETRALYKKIRKGEMKPIQVERSEKEVTSRHNLPHSLSTFIGREKQLDEISRLVAKSRLVTLAGAGGIGKTSMSVQVGHRLIQSYPDGVWFISFDSLSDPGLVNHTVASIFDIREGAVHTVLERLNDYLRSKTALLIFDNCEHLLSACAQLVTSLLGNCPDLHILTTSRETLNVVGEAIYTMPSLSLPESDMPVEGLIQYESVRLFTERAALAYPSFVLTAANAQSVVEICRKVDGIPLAIELAAAHVNILQVDEILKQLQDSFALLSSNRHTILPRHQTLQASMDWGWGLLEGPERRFLCQLAVFAGGWTLESAQAVCDGDVFNLTSAIAKKSLIVVDQAAGRKTRYRFHEIVRQYVHEKLIEASGEKLVRTRHLEYFTNLSERAELELRGPSLVDWMEHLNDDRNNLRVALHWADQSDIEAGLYLSSNLMRYWESANLPEGRRWLENFIQKPESKDFPLARAHALSAYGWLLTWLQQFDQAQAVAEEGLALFRSGGNRQGEIDVLISIENMYQFKNDLETAVQIGRQAVALAESLDDHWRLANALLYLGWCYHDLEKRFGYWEKAISLYREVGDRVTLANLLGLIAQFRVLRGEIEIGEKCVDEALSLWEANRRANIWDNPRVTKSLIASMKGEYEQAEALLREVMISAQERGNRMSYIWAQVRLGYVAFHAGNWNEAHYLLNESARDFMQDGYTIGIVFAVEGLAGLAATVGKTDRAARLIGWADAVRENISDVRPPLEQADVDLSIAACIARVGKTDYRNAYEAGKRMSLEDAVAYALDERMTSIKKP